MDDATRFTEAFTHLRTGAPCRDRIGLLNVLLAEGINLGLRSGVVRCRRRRAECKVLYGSLGRTIAARLEQTAAYMDRCVAREGHLVIIDRAAEGRSWDEKVFHPRMTSRRGIAIDVWGM